MNAKARCVVALVLCVATGFAWAQGDWPAKPVRFIVPFAPGGTTDILARVMGEQLGQALKQPFPVDNRGGAGGNLGAAELAKSAPDGYTIMMGTPGTQSINQFIYSNMPYDTAKAFAPVVYVARLNAESNRILQKPEVKERFASLGADPVGGSPQDLANHIAAETVKWKEVVRVSGAKLD